MAAIVAALQITDLDSAARIYREATGCSEGEAYKTMYELGFAICGEVWQDIVVDPMTGHPVPPEKSEEMEVEIVPEWKILEQAAPPPLPVQFEPIRPEKPVVRASSELSGPHGEAISPERIAKIAEALQHGDKTAAIKHYRDAVLVGLDDATSAIDAYANHLTGRKPPPLQTTEQPITSHETPAEKSGGCGCLSLAIASGIIVLGIILLNKI